MIDLSNIILDMYTSILGQSIAIDELFLKLQRKISQELEFHASANKLTGQPRSLTCRPRGSES